MYFSMFIGYVFTSNICMGFFTVVSGVQYYDLWSALNQLFVVRVGSKLLSHLYIHNYNVLVITFCANL
jgi:hypothetical protein